MIGVVTVGVMTVGVTTVGVMTVGVMTVIGMTGVETRGEEVVVVVVMIEIAVAVDLMTVVADVTSGVVVVVVVGREEEKEVVLGVILETLGDHHQETGILEVIEIEIEVVTMILGTSVVIESVMVIAVVELGDGEETIHPIHPVERVELGEEEVVSTYYLFIDDNVGSHSVSQS
jgi:hypothetical protein